MSKHFALAVVLLMLHSLAVVGVWYVSVSEPGGCFRGIEWLPIWIIDYPVAVFVPDMGLSTNQSGALFLVAGGVQWFLMGLLLQGAIRWIAASIR